MLEIFYFGNNYVLLFLEIWNWNVLPYYCILLFL